MAEESDAEFTDRVIAESRDRVVSDRAEVIRAAIVSELRAQAAKYPGFRFETTNDRNLFAVGGIMSVSELAEVVARTLG